MTITFVLNGKAVNDQTTGLQTGDGDDGFTDTDVAYSSLPVSFKTYLESTLGLNPAFPTSVGVATKTNSVTVNASAGGLIAGTSFTDGTGGALNGDDSGLDTVSGKNILLFADGDDTVIGRYDSDGNGSADAVAFVIFKQSVVNAGATSAQVTFHVVTYAPIFHADNLNPDDAVNLGNSLKLAASEKIAFSFGGTPSGQHLFTMVTSGGAGLVVTPETEVIKLNISQGGGPTTLGVSNQMIDPGEALVFTFVTNPNANFTVPNLSQGEADGETNILFGGLNTASGGSVSISQTQANVPAGMRLTAYNTKGDGGATEPTGNGFINGYANDPIAAISEVRIFNASGTLLLTATGDVSTPVNGITVDFLASGQVEVRGLLLNYKVEYDAAAHERLKVAGVAGKFDIGGISVETLNSQSTSVGQLIVIEDDGPTVTANATVLLDDDVLPGGNPGGTGDDFNAVNVSGTLGHSFGTDGGSIAFLTTGAPAGFTYQLSGSNLLVKQGATTVLTVTLNTATGAYAVTQNNPIAHAAWLTENNQCFTVTYRVTDGDGDKAGGTLTINVDDDTPTVTANATVLLDDDALAGGNPGGTGDNVDAASTSGTLGHSFGADGGSIAFLTTGAPAGFTYQLSGSSLLVKQGATTVLTVTLNTATGAYAVTQNNPILHAAGLNENNQCFTVTYRVTDGDGDPINGTLTINVDDDTPTVSANATVLLDDDALAGGNPGGTGDNVDAASTSGTLGHSFGADGGSIAFLTTGAPAGFTYQLSGSNLLVKQGATTVLTVTLNTATGAYAVTQNNPIAHVAGLNENNQCFTVTYRAMDGDGDPVNGTLTINVDDDTPTVSANATVLLDDDALAGGNPGGTGDNVDAASTSGTLGHSFGADGGSIAFLTTGAPAGFTYQLSGSSLLVRQGATTVLTVTLNTATGAYAVTQNNPIAHADGLDENNQAFTLDYQVTDGDGDPVDGTLTINVDDDTPTVTANATVLLDDDALAGGNPGGTGDNVDAASTSGTLGHSFGADGGSIAFLTTGAPAGFTYQLSGSNLLVKQGATTVLTVTLNTATGAYAVTQNNPIAHADGLDENNQAFTLDYQVTDGDGDPIDGTLTINVDDDTPTVTANATVLLDDDALAGGNPGGTGDNADAASTSGTLGHSFGADGGSITFLTTGAPAGFTYQLSGSSLLVKQGAITVLTVTLDTATGAYAVTQNNPILHAAGLDENNQAFTLDYQVTDGDGDTTAGTLSIDVDDDTPIIGPIADGLVDFAAGDSVTNSLNGSVGADGPVTYSVVSSPAVVMISDGTSAERTLLRDISGDGTAVTYFQDADNSGTLTAGDTEFFKLTLAGGAYTFEVLADPAPAMLEFSFDELPAGANLFGVVGTSSAEPAIVVIGQNIVLNADGSYANTSDVIHTSQGGTGATIGVNNQLFDNVGEGAYFTYVDNPVQDFLSGALGGLTATEADDADNIQYTGGTIESGTASFAISQMQGNDLAAVKITAFDIAGAPQGVAFVNSLGTGTARPIDAVRVFDSGHNLIETSDGSVNDLNVTIAIVGGVATVGGLDEGYTVEWDTIGVHDQALIEYVGGQFDIGRFSTKQPQPTPDEKLDFTIQIADADGDTDSDSFSIGIDGTGLFDDNHVDGVIA